MGSSGSKSNEKTTKSTPPYFVDTGELSLSRLLEGAENLGLFVLDSAGQVTNWNAGAQRLFGYRLDEMVGNHFRHLFTSEDQQASVPERDLTRASQEDRAVSERWYVRQDGGSLWGSGILVALKDGELEGFGCIIHDLTAQKLEEDEQNGLDLSH